MSTQDWNQNHPESSTFNVNSLSNSLSFKESYHKRFLQYDVCIVGAGLSGAIIAERYATTLEKTVYVMEKRNHIGGNCFDYVDKESGIRVNKYGAVEIFAAVF
jgi:hypothetical protein